MKKKASGTYRARLLLNARGFEQVGVKNYDGAIKICGKSYTISCDGHVSGNEILPQYT
jgi:hypothetical protein